VYILFLKSVGLVLVTTVPQIKSYLIRRKNKVCRIDLCRIPFLFLPAIEGNMIEIHIIFYQSLIPIFEVQFKYGIGFAFNPMAYGD
jgi:hypothetical protein